MEIISLGWDDYLDAGGICVIEWADKFPGLLPPKTQWLSFTMKENQLTKCKNVAKLIFVEAPSNSSDAINIWESPKDERNFRTRTTRDGRKMYLLGKEHMTLLTSIDDDVLVNELKSFSNSTWRGN